MDLQVHHRRDPVTRSSLLDKVKTRMVASLFRDVLIGPNLAKNQGEDVDGIF
jgi:hypothetical protein